MISLSAYKYGVLLQVARELIDDTAVDLLGYLAMQAGRALGNNFGNALVNGTGSGGPNGLINLATSALLVPRLAFPVRRLMPISWTWNTP